MHNAFELKWARAWPGIVLLLCVAAYWPALNGPLLLDDFTVLPQLLAARDGGQTLIETLQSAPSHVRGRALANLSFVLSDELTPGAQGQARAQKIGNLLLHLIVGLLVVRLGREVTRIAGANAQTRTWAPLFAGAVFLLHPLLLSTVAYSVQRMAILSTLFVLLAVLSYLAWRRGLEEIHAAPWRQWVRLACVPLFTILAFASKENGALAPLLIGCLELFLLRWPPRDSPIRDRFEQGFGLCVAAPLALGVVMLGLRWPALLAAFDERDFTMAERVLTQIHVLWEYLGHWFWPRVSAMGLYRDDIAVVAAPDAATTVLGLALGAVLVGAIVLHRRFALASFAVGWFFAAHAMESTILSLELYFEHRNYLAGPGIALLVGVLLAKLPLRVAVGSAVVLALLLGLQTAQRARDWSGFDSFMRAEVRHHPQSLRAGVEWVLELERFPNRRGEAAREVERLAADHPDHAQPALLALFLQCHELGPAERITRPDGRWWSTARVNKDSFHLFDALHVRMSEGRCPALGVGTLGEIAHAIAGSVQLASRPRARAAWWRQAGRLSLGGDDCELADAAFTRTIEIDDSDPRDAIYMMQCALAHQERDRYMKWRQHLLSRFSTALPDLRNDVARMDSQWARPGQ